MPKNRSSAEEINGQDDKPSGFAAITPLKGCYERIYDAAHLAAHRGQLVVRATLSITPPPPETQEDKANRIVAEADLKMWVGGRQQSFNSLGVCRAQNDGLLCHGSLSAAEVDSCTSMQDGLRECRIGPNDGWFQIDKMAAGVLVTIRERLELVQAPYDSGPFLYFNPTNVENHDFLLLKMASEVCQ